ncbi:MULTISPECIES: hypothetical protein [unclassified Streptomyces]|uniref:hypothetical protein n=1 Tax=unclassified Streptomyces TaxID=2593676 RepID=UPI00093BC82C|nr:hypothetical protein [Streptomyces sp. TSRI0281]OKI37409.1 hypothetical protein A6A29_40535 [Streptomyces sp. TSRI0281]
MIARRMLGPGPEDPAHSVRASQADLLDVFPGVRLPDLDGLRARGVLGTSTTTPPAARRALGTGGHTEEELAPDSSVRPGLHDR